MLFLLLSRRHRSRASEVPSFGTFLKRLEMLALVLVCMAISYHVAEHATWFDSLWLVWQTVTTVGYGDIPPKTAVGRTGVMICGIIGIILLTYVVSAGLEYREERNRRKRQGMDANPNEGSYLIVCCRDEDKLQTLIDHLRRMDKSACICVVDDVMKELPEHIARIPNLRFVQGNILKPETYERAGISTSKQVIFFPHQPGQPISDTSTFMLVSLAEDLAPPHVPIMYFLVDPDNKPLFKGRRAHAIPTDFALHAAVQECQEPGSTEIFSTLLSNTYGANPTTFHPTMCIGWSWGKFLEKLPKASSSIGQPVTPLALTQGGRPQVCPNLDVIIGSGDTIFLIAHPGFSFDKLGEELGKSS